MVITKEQLEERRNYLGGSDAAKILGLSNWGSPLQVFMAKVHPNPDDSEVRIGGKNEAAYWGNALEDKVAEAFAEVTGKKVYRVNETLIHPEYDFIRANIDRRVVGEDAGLECKTVTAFKAKDWEDEEMPLEYILQCQHYMAVTGKKSWYLACLIGGQKLVIKTIERDDVLIQGMIEAEVRFWNDFVLTKKPPLATGSKRDTQLISRLYPEATTGTEIELTDIPEQMLKEREAAERRMKEAEAAVDEIENRIKASLGEVEVGRTGNYIITWKNQSRTSVDGKTLKAEHPEVYAQVQKETKYRVLKIKQLKGEK